MSKAPIQINPKHKGLLHQKLGIAADKPIPEDDLTIPKGTSGNALALKREVIFAKNAKKWNHKP